MEPGCPDEIGIDAIETLIVPRAHDLGGFEVRRALPSPKRRMVGPEVVLFSGPFWRQDKVDLWLVHAASFSSPQSVP
jgi:hypothetical protein